MMTTPGVYFEEVSRSRPGIGVLRTDIAAFLGYSERGPLLTPVKVESWRQFQAVFGAPLANTYLGYAVRGFFENHGASAYVVRIADPDGAAAAEVVVAGGDGQPSLRLLASHGVVHDPATGKALADSQVHNPDNGRARDSHGTPQRYPSPGTWANRLAVSLSQTSLGITTTVEVGPGGETVDVISLAGFEAGSAVRLSQVAITAPALRRISAIDAVRRRILWEDSIEGLGLDLTQPVRLESVEFDLQVLEEGQVVETLRNLSPSEAHSRYLVRVIEAQSRLLDADLLADQTQVLDPERLPAAVFNAQLSGGTDGLVSVSKIDYFEGLSALARVRDVSLLSAPDLVLVPEGAEQEQRIFLPVSPCESLEPVPGGKLRGIVRELRDGEEGPPIAGVRVRVFDTSLDVETGPDGVFELQQLAEGRVRLLMEAQGYFPLEVTAQTQTFLPPPPAVTATFYLSPVTLPPALSLDDVYDVQDAMVRQGEQGLYRVALLDPPWSMLGIDEIQTWRARFDSSYAVLYYPWLQVDARVGSDLRAVPPSGHVAGVIARTDLSQGVERAPANYVLDGVKGLTEDLGDALQGVLNPLGINCLRALRGRGIRVYGARTLSTDPEWRYVNVRRLVSMIEASVEQASQWAVFEPNNFVTREALGFGLSSFLDVLWRRGALAGASPEQAYEVRCDDVNNPSASVAAGALLAEIAVAPAIPFEFIRFRLGRTEEAIEIRE
jgi:phage tail sheath protein FI